MNITNENKKRRPILPEGVSLQLHRFDEVIFTSSGKWLHPLFELEDYLKDNDLDTSDLIIHDHISGKAGAILIARLGFRKCFIDIVSIPALEIFKCFNIKCDYKSCVDKIGCATEDIVFYETDIEKVYRMLLQLAGRIYTMNIGSKNHFQNSGRNKSHPPSVTALIISAGFSSRMFAHKALYPIEDELVIERTIKLLHDGGINLIHLVTGYKKELINKRVTLLQNKNKCHEKKIRIVDNPDYKNGMFSSIKAGVSSIPGETEGLLIVPVDYPFINPQTIYKLLESFYSSDADIISPVFNGKEGHPPIIRNTVFENILNADSSAPSFQGLHSVLQRQDFSRLLVETGDSGILDDIDTDKSYCRLLKKYYGKASVYPDADECGRILEAKNPGGGTIAHMEKTAALAVEIAEKLNSRGLKLNPGMLYSAALLHDVCRSMQNHAAAAADYLSNIGYPEIGRIIGQHMDIERNKDDKIDEAAILYLADKMLEGDKLVSLEKRMAAKLKLFSDNVEAQKNIKKRFEKAFLIKEAVDAILK